MKKKRRAPTKAEIAKEERILRYLSIENVAKDFKSAKERAAMQALFYWFSLNGVCAWVVDKKKTLYSTSVGQKFEKLNTPQDAIVLAEKTWEHAEKVLKLRG